MAARIGTFQVSGPDVFQGCPDSVSHAGIKGVMLNSVDDHEDSLGRLIPAL
jgi:hypothetical protein